MDAKITWTTGLSFSGRADSGFELPLGAAQEGFRPMELIALGLVGCTGMDVISILEKNRKISSIRLWLSIKWGSLRIFSTRGI